MIKGITYSSGNMEQSAAKCIASMKNHGFDKAERLYCDQCPDCLGDFYILNSKTLKAERGAGYWLWKPYLIFHAMYFMNDDDILVWSDAGIEWIGNVREIVNRMDQDIFMFTNGWKHVEWCKMDCIMAINGYDDSDFRGTDYDVRDYAGYTQVQASVIFFRVNQKTRDFVKEWLLWCQMPGFIDDSPSKLPNFPTFAEHRHDQAILTCLAIKYGYNFNHWWPTPYSMHLPRTDQYPVLFNHHRKRDNEF